jgi:hypothetical protein
MNCTFPHEAGYIVDRDFLNFLLKNKLNQQTLLRSSKEEKWPKEEREKREVPADDLLQELC